MMGFKFIFLFVLSSQICASQYSYDDLNRLTQVTYPEGTTAYFTYDILGNILTDSIAQTSCTINISSISNGTTTPTGDIIVNPSDTVTISSIPKEGYHFQRWEVSDSISIIDSSSTGKFTASGEGSIKAYFDKNKITLTLSPGTGGTISPSGDTIVSYGDTLEVFASSNTGFSFSSWNTTGAITIIDNSANGKFVAKGIGSINALFERNNYAVTISSATGGATTPSGDTVIEYGDTLSATATSNDGHSFSAWNTTGAITKIDSSNSGKFIVTGAGTIHALFETNIYTVRLSSAIEGAINPSGDTVVNYGDTLLAAATPNSGFSFSSWNITGAIVVINEDINGKFLITGAGSIQPVFVALHKITSFAETGGTINPDGISEIKTGESINYLINENEGYQIDSVLIDSNNKGDKVVYTFENVQTSHSIIAFFSPNLIKNGTFVTGLNNWGNEVHDGCSADFDTVNGSCVVHNKKITVTGASEVYKIQLKQRTTSLKPSTTYKLTFKCKGTIPGITLEFIVDKSPWNTNIGLWMPMNISNSWKEYDTSFTTNAKFQPLTDTIKFCIHTATDTGMFIIDNIRLLEKRVSLSFSNVYPQTIHEDSTLVLTLAMTDAKDTENKPLRMIFQDGEHYSVDGSTISPSPNFNGDLSVPVRITNGEDTTSALNMKISVTPVNDAPVAEDSFSKTLHAGKPWEYLLKAEDIDNNTLAWHTAEPAPSGFTLFQNGSIEWTPENADAGKYIIKAVVSDGALTDTVTINISVEPSVNVVSSNKTNKKIGPAGERFNAYYDKTSRTVIFICRNIANVDVTVSIYDNVANLLFKDTKHLPFLKTTEWKEFNRWDCKNRHGRTVSEVTVLVFINSAQGGNMKVIKKLIGITNQHQ